MKYSQTFRYFHCTDHITKIIIIMYNTCNGYDYLLYSSRPPTVFYSHVRDYCFAYGLLLIMCSAGGDGVGGDDGVTKISGTDTLFSYSTVTLAVIRGKY
jgi:hypothetical protein